MLAYGQRFWLLAPMFKRILIATNFEDGLHRLTHCLSELYTGGVQQVNFVHSMEWEGDSHGLPEDPTPMIEATKRRLLESCGSIPEDMTVEALVQIGKPAAVIRQAYEKFQPEVLLVGMAIRNLLVEKVFGSTTMEALSRAPIPVLVLRPQLIATFTLDELRLRSRNLFRSVLVTYDFSEFADHLLNRLIEQIQYNGEQQLHTIWVLYVIDPSSRQHQSGDLQQQKQEYEQKLEELKQRFAGDIPEVEIKTEVRIGAPVKEILMAAGEADMTAIATASGNVGSFWEWSIRSTTGELLRKSWHSVLFFPSSSST